MVTAQKVVTVPWVITIHQVVTVPWVITIHQVVIVQKVKNTYKVITIHKVLSIQIRDKCSPCDQCRQGDRYSQTYRCTTTNHSYDHLGYHKKCLLACRQCCSETDNDKQHQHTPISLHFTSCSITIIRISSPLPA